MKTRVFKKLRGTDLWFMGVTKAFAVILALIILIPFFWMLTSTLKTTEEYLNPNLIFSKNPQWGNFREVFINLKFYRYIINSLILAFMSVLFSVFSSAFVAFGFARFKFPLKTALFGILLATMMLPGQVTIIPQYLLFRSIKWTGTFLPLTIPQLCGAAGSVLLITQFMKSVPKAMDEAAKIDGAGYMRIFFRIMLPQIVPILLVVSLFTFLNSWKDSFGPLVYLRNKDWYTVPLALMAYISPNDPNRAIMFTGLTISLLPTIIVYAVGQKYLENGIVLADLK